MKEARLLVFALLIAMPCIGSADETPSASPRHSDLPISINADDLEAVMQGGKKKFVFRKNVVVEQGEMILHTDALEAFYPEGGSEPDRLIATGNVFMEKDGSQLTCDHATYIRAEDRLICEGDALMVSGQDRLSAGRIDMQIETGVVKASIDVKVNVTPKSSDKAQKDKGKTDNAQADKDVAGGPAQ